MKSPASIMTITALFALALVSPVATAGHLNTVGTSDSPTHILFGECREVFGTVTDLETGDPLENLTVVAVPAGADSLVNVYSHAHTQADGTYSLFVHNTGNYQIIAVDDRLAQDGNPVLQEAPGHEPQQHEEIVIVDDPDCEEPPAERNFSLNPLAADDPTGAIEITLSELLATVPVEMGAALADQEIGLGVGTCEPVSTQTTDDDGKARFEDLPRDQEYCLSFTHDDYEDNSTTLLLDSALVQVQLNTTRLLQEVSGSVLDTHAGDGIAGVGLSIEHPLFCPDGASSMPAAFVCDDTTDADGDYTLFVPWSQDDDYELEFDMGTLQGYEGSNSSTVAVGPPSEGAVPSTDFPLDRTQAVLEGRVLERALPVALAGVCLDGVTGCTVTSASGHFMLLVTWDDYTLTITHPDGTTHSQGASMPYNGLDIGDFDFDPIREGISGIVTDITAGGVPIADVEVKAFDETDPITPIPCGLTAADGSFFCEVPPGEYTLNVTTGLYEDLPGNLGPFTVNPEDDTDAGTIVLDRLAVSVIEGSVSDADDSGADTSLAGATVEISGSATGVTGSTTTGAGGAYTFTDLPWDTYTIDVTMTDYQQNVSTGNSVSVANDTSNAFTKDMDLERTLHKIAGAVTDADAGDATVQGVTVKAVGQDVDAMASATTDNMGGYEFTGLPWGAYELEFVHSAYQSAVASTAIVPPGDTQGLSTSLDRLRSNITGFMLENQGMFADPSPLPGQVFEMVCDGADTAGFSVTLTTNETLGNYTIKGLAWDTFICTAQDPEPAGGADHLFYENEEVFMLPPDENLTGANFTLTRQSWLVHGFVRDATDDSPIPDIRLCINNLNDIERTPVCQRTGADGGFSEPMRYVDVGSTETNLVTIAVDGNEDYFSGAAAALIGPDLGHEDERNVTVMPQDAGVQPPSANISLINGRVLDADATTDLGVAGVLVNATHQDVCLGAQPEGASAADGNYTVAVGCEGTWDLGYSHPAGLYKEAVLEGVEVEDSLNVTFAPDVALERTTGNATVNVTDLLTMQGVEGTNVTVTGIDTDTGPTWMLTDADGNATFTDLPWGAYEATVNATHTDGAENETVTGFVVLPGENATAQAFIIGEPEPPETPECVGDEGHVCEPTADPGVVVVQAITSDRTGSFLVAQPQLGNVTNSTGSQHEPQEGPHNGTWFVMFQPDDGPPGAGPVTVTVEYTNSSGDPQTLSATTSGIVAGQTRYSPLVWMVNLHTDQSVACLPQESVPAGFGEFGNDCAQNPSGLQEPRFFLPD